MCTYLAKRGSTYYFRRPIPKQLQPAFDGAEAFMWSLRTKDRDAAKQLIPFHTIETDRRLEEARKSQGSVPAAAVEAEPEEPEEVLTEAQREELEFEQQEAEARAERRRLRRPKRDEFRRRMQYSTARLSSTEQVARDLRRDRDEEIRRLREQSLAWLRQAEVAPAATAEVVPAAKATNRGVMLDTTIVDLWAAERRVRAKTKDAYAAAAREFYKNTGRMRVGDITRKHVLGFKDALLSQGQTVPNINTKLSRLRTLLQWAYENDHAAENAAKDIIIRGAAAAGNKRLPFDLSDLRAIFDSPIYSKGDRPTQGRGEAAYWLPLLALFTGARMEELGQLRPGDIKRISYPDEDGTEQAAWFISITDLGDGDLQLKNDGSERLVPVHPELERLGFVRYIERVREANEPRAFPLLKPGAYGRLTAKWGEWFTAKPALRIKWKRVVQFGIAGQVPHIFGHGGKPCRAAIGPPVLFRETGRRVGLLLIGSAARQAEIGCATQCAVFPRAG